MHTSIKRGNPVPTISFIQPKGGSGKSTSALLLATELAKQTDVAVIDADPNTPIAKWAERGGSMENLTVHTADQRNSLMDAIEEIQTQSSILIIDTEGVADLRAAQAISMSDFVVVPSQGTALDQDNAANAIRLIKEQEKVSRRQIPHAVLFTRVSAAIRSRGMKAAEQQLEKSGIPTFNTRIIEREAFKAMFAFNKPLGALNSRNVSGLDNAQMNAMSLCIEMVHKLTTGSSTPQEEVA